MRIRAAWGHDGREARKFSIEDRTTEQRTVNSCAKLACISFAEGSITEEEYLILYEE